MWQTASTRQTRRPRLLKVPEAVWFLVLRGGVHDGKCLNVLVYGLNHRPIQRQVRFFRRPARHERGYRVFGGIDHQLGRQGRFCRQMLSSSSVYAVKSLVRLKGKADLSLGMYAMVETKS